MTEPLCQVPVPPFVTDQRYREILSVALDHICEGVTVFDAHLRLITCNRAFLEMFEFPAALGEPGTPFEALVRYNAERGEYGPGDVDTRVAERILDAETFRTQETRRRRPDGTLLLIRGFPLPDEGFITLYSDITEHQREREALDLHHAQLEAHIAERTEALTRSNRDLREALAHKQVISKALRHSEARVRLITDTIPAHIAYFDSARIYRYANRRYAEWFDHTVDSMTDRPIAKVIGEALAEHLEPHISAALAGAEVTYEYSRLGPDGARQFARSTLLPEITPDGDVLGCFVHSVDITEARRTHNALALAQKMEAIGQLTGGLAHDFNNMLTVIMGNLTGLREALPDDPQVADHVTPALSAAEGGADLIQRLLTFSRQQTMEPRPVEVNALVLDMARLIRRSVPKSIQVSTHAHQAELITCTDPHQLQSAVLNLALNARDAMPNGGLIEIECSLETLTGASADDLEVPPGDYVQIAVTDYGTGMDGSILARVFEPFFTTKQFGMGSGLGLSMVYGFIKQARGGVRIRSRQAVGTTVALLLPRADAHAPGVRAPATGQAVPIENLLVLLVEDQADVRQVVRNHLAALGCHVLEAESGHEAADLIERVPAIGAVLSDVVMPGGMDGRALARFVHRLRPHLPLLLMSGFADQQGQRPDDTQPTHVLPKPFTRAQLAQALGEALGHERATGGSATP